MILILGPLYSGKGAYARHLMGWTEEELAQNAVSDAQDLARTCRDREALEALAQELAQAPVVLFTETGGGVVPLDRQERIAREQAGRLSCLLAQRAEKVVRVFCGLPMTLKGD